MVEISTLLPVVWANGAKVFSAGEISSGQTSLGKYRDFSFEPRMARASGTERRNRPAYVSHARRRLGVFWRDADAYAAAEESTPLFLPIRSSDCAWYGSGWSRSELRDRSARGIQHSEL